MKNWIKYILLIVLGYSGFPVLGQFTADALKLGYDPLTCISDGSLAVVVDNLSYFEPGADEGVFTIEWGDGNSDTWGQGLSDSKKSHTYSNFGTYELALTWKKNGGDTFVKKFPLTLKRAPQGTFEVKSSGACVNQKTQFEIYNFQENTAETKYRLLYQKGSEYLLFKDLTQTEVMMTSGIIDYVFKETMCNRMVLLQVTNECVDLGLVNTSEIYIPMTVLAPLNISFDVQPDPVCTGMPFTMKLIKDSQGGCNMNIQYEWILKDNGKYTGENPLAKPYTKDGKYNISLISSIKNYGCASDTASYDLTVIKRAVADFEADKKTACIVGDVPAVINFANKSSGDDIIANTWFVDGVQQSTGQNFSDFTHAFTQPGEYNIQLHVRNSCSDSIKYMAVSIKQDPHIVAFDLPDTLCARDYIVRAEDISFQWNGNTPAATWTVKTPAGVERIIDGVHPTLPFSESGDYVIMVKIAGVGCGGTTLNISKKVNVVRNDITVDVRPDKLPKNDTIQLCDGEVLSFDNHSTGDNLVYEWTVETIGPHASDLVVAFEPGYSPTSPSPKFRFEGYGDCILRDNIRIKQGCNAKETQFKVHVGKAPTIAVFSMGQDTLICGGRELNMQDYVYCEWYNNPRKFVWDWPVEVIGNTTVLYPVLSFPTAGKYTLKLELSESKCRSAETEYKKSVDIRVRPSALKVKVKQDPAAGIFCEGTQIRFRNEMTDAEGKDQVSFSWSVTKVGGWEQTPEVATAILPWTFPQYGDYKITGKAINYCGDLKEETLDVTIHKNPRVTLKDTSMCPGTLKMENYVTYDWYNNTNRTATWEINGPVDGYSGDLTTLYPVLELKKAGDYIVRVKVPDAGCTAGIDETLAERTYHVFDTAITGTVRIIGVGNVENPNEVCEGQQVTFENTISAERPLTWSWKVEGDAAGYHFGGGALTADIANPQLIFTKAGDYVVKLLMEEGCSSRSFQFPVDVEGIPQIQIADVDSVCEPYTFRPSQIIVLNTADIRSAAWQITPATGFDPFDATVKDPTIRFQAGTFRVEVSYWNRCPDPGKKAFTVNVDKFIDIKPLRDTAVCVLTEPFLLKAFPDTGVWTSAKGKLITKNGHIYFNPDFDPYYEGDIEVAYKLRNRTCIAYDTMNVHIRPLPYIEAGNQLEMCPNHSPYPLVGKDSAKGNVWQDNRGVWKQDGGILNSQSFDPAGKTPGDFTLYYEYADIHGCTNTDSTIMALHPLPSTNFTVRDKNCIFTDVIFTPADTVGNRFEWDFGDGSPFGLSKEIIRHEYGDYGWRDVVCMAETKFGCKDTSANRRIEIINLPAGPHFDVDTLNGCSPLNVEITIDPGKYVEDHNYLRFRWDYGEGTVEESLGDRLRIKKYRPGAWDTTYITRFTVMNMCDTLHYDTAVTVYSVPQVAAALMHRWECTPVDLEVQNTTTGNNCVFNWMITNDRNRDTVRDLPHSRNLYYTFDTDSASTTYAIHLRAENICSVDDTTALLTVKPRSVRAHFTPLDDAFACVGEEILFRNNSTDTVSSILITKWQFGDGAVDSTWSSKHRFTAPGTYPVSLWIHNGCGWHADTLSVTILPLPRLNIQSEDFLCETDTFSFVLKSDQELQNIQWKFGDGYSSNKDSIRHCYDGYGTFPVTVIGVSADFNRCTDSVKKEIVVYNKPIMTKLPLDTAHCSPLLYRPLIEGDALLLWNYGDGTQITTANEHLYENPTDSVQKFKVTIHAETNKGCKSTFERQVMIYNNPRAIVDKKVEKGNPQKVTFINLSEEYTDCIWELPFKGTLHSHEDQVLEFYNNGNYNVKLIAQNYQRCLDTAIIEHEVLIKGLYFPNTFIPHSLNGKISHFNGIGMGLQQYKLEIFDQYGNKIWETQVLEDGKPSEGWDGCNSQGKRMPQGIYVWRAEAIFADDEVWAGKNNESGVPETTQGTVMLLRE